MDISLSSHAYVKLNTHCVVVATHVVYSIIIITIISFITRTSV